MTRLRAWFRTGQPENNGKERLVPDRDGGPTKPDHTPNVSYAARNLALAHHIERLVDRGLIPDYSAAADMLGVSQPRMTMLMGLVLLSPKIQEAILLGCTVPREKMLRKLARLACWEEQGQLLTT